MAALLRFLVVLVVVVLVVVAGTAISSAAAAGVGAATRFLLRLIIPPFPRNTERPVAVALLA